MAHDMVGGIILHFKSLATSSTSFASVGTWLCKGQILAFVSLRWRHVVINISILRKDSKMVLTSALA